ncbi:HET-C-related protein [Pseudomonas sp. NPDC088368]|jgi:hypothetical protein|uniref:HET-C-related protein n=1 Tax=Pseudomonas sp. NPDC088368 TaxID=3364453 RepID=UPI00382225E1
MDFKPTLRFEAGSEDAHGHTHQSIEAVLEELGFHSGERQATYFGNWLRDYSQVIDPKLVRAPDMPKEFPTVLSRQAWTDLVDVLAVKKFQELREGNPNHMKVTTAKLGVYVPAEHIDNPLAIDPPFPDPTVRDPDFQPWVLPGDPVLDVNPDTSMKRYISSAIDYMNQQLEVAKFGKRSLKGLRSFGAALHVVEDLFAHSNFAELALIKAGHKDVLPWTTPVEATHALALVTGTFGGSDIIASLASPLGRILYSTKELEFELTQVEYRSDRDKVMLIMLSEHPDQDYYRAFNALLSARDQMVVLAQKAGIDTVRFYRWLLATPAGIVLNAYNTAAQSVLTWIGNSVDDAQLALGSDPNTDPGVEPSHSQLSKDHAEHPLHDLTARLATEAVRQVAQAIIDHWEGNPDADPVAVASSFFCHPEDSEWQDAIVEAWAAEHPEQIKRAESKSDLDQVHQQAVAELTSIHDQMIHDSEQFLDYLFNSQDELPTGFQGYAEQAFMTLLSNTQWGQALLSLVKE